MNQEEAKEITAKGSLTFAQYMKFVMYRQRKTFFIVSIVSLPMFIVLYNDLNIINVHSLSIFDYVLVLLSSLIYVLLILLGMFFKFFREYKNDSLIRQEMTYILTSNSIRQITQKVTATYYWNDFITIKEQKDLFLLYLSKTRTMVIPKTFFKNTEDIRQFKQFVKDNKK